jgi:hypothetical protein
MVAQESNYLQFGTDSMPRFGEPNGWGLMQLDTAAQPTIDAVWSWPQNLTKGVQHLNSMKAGALNAWTNRVQDWNTWNTNNPTLPVGTVSPPAVALSALGQTNCNFGMTQTGGEPAGAHSYGDAVWMKRYNGASSNPNNNPPFQGGDYIVWRTNDPNSDRPYWEYNYLNNDGHNYVNAVCIRVP